MFKKIKKYFEFQRRYQHEVLETLASICLFLEYDGRRGRIPYAEHMRSHFEVLKILSEELRGQKEKSEGAEKWDLK